jgi:hypothetical protein
MKKKIISYSLFGTNKKYYVGAEKNIKINKELLPDWETVIYYHEKMTDIEYINYLKTLGAKTIDISNVIIGEKESIHFPYFWRFLTFLTNNISLVRDLDSRISKREVDYINIWLKNKKEYFIIRDHPWQSPVPSGLFGINGMISSFENHLHEYIKNSDLRWGTDQDILYEYILNIPKENIEYCGFDKPETYIPRDNKNFFIGMQLDENDNPTVPSGELSLNFLKELNL